MSEEKFYNIQEFSNLIRVHPNTVRRAIKNGMIQAFKTGVGKRSAYRISSNEVSRISEVDMTKIIERIVEQKLEERSGNI